MKPSDKIMKEKACKNCYYAGNFEPKLITKYIIETGIRCLECPCTPLKNLNDYCFRFKPKEDKL